MRVKALLFGHYRDVADCIDVELPEGATTADLAGLLESREPRLRGLAEHCRVAVNQDYVGRVSPLQSGDEVAYIPPMSGG